MIIKEVADVFLEALRKTELDFDEMDVIELGNIIIKNCCAVNGKKSAKDWFKEHGVNSHTSIDINGRNGALALDLGQPLPQFNYKADITTNCGTAEHVQNIYECYKNIHNFTSEGGVMLHWGPITNHCKWHSPWAYELHFPYELCRMNEYTLIDCDIAIPVKGRNVEPMDNSLIWWIAIKDLNDEFISEREFNNIKGLEYRK